MDPVSTDHEQQGLWPFALALYGAPGVSVACLALQDSAGADVPMVLWAAWIGAGGGQLGDADAARAHDAVAAWHRDIVRPLRALRQRMKTGPAPAPSTQTEALRDRLKAVEIGAERIELDVLESLPTQAVPGSTPPLRAVRHNLRAVLGAGAADLPELVDMIVAAAANLAGEDRA